MLCDVGRHSDLPVENLSLSRCGSFLASCSHDSTVRFWNIDNIRTQTVDASRRASRPNRSNMASTANSGDFFADMATDVATNASANKATVSSGDSSSDDGDDSCDDAGDSSDDNDQNCND